MARVIGISDRDSCSRSAGVMQEKCGWCRDTPGRKLKPEERWTSVKKAKEVEKDVERHKPSASRNGR
jgi:hypothetical protein